MKQKNIKVAYTNRLSGSSYTQVPKIQMEGHWLEELGFSIGSTIVVEYGENSLYIRPMTEAELIDKQRKDAKKELDCKAAEIRKLQLHLEDGYHELSHVAESSQKYPFTSKKSSKCRR